MSAEDLVKRQQKIDKSRNVPYGAVDESVRVTAKKKRVKESTNETDTSVSREGNRWTRYWMKQGSKVYKALHD